jgi:hypothetical protein
MTPPARLATALRHQAQGIYCLEAAAELLIAHGTWLHRADFTTGFIILSRGLTDGQWMAAVDWAAAITALAAGHLPCSGGEQRMLRLIASIADGIPADLHDILTGIDHHNIQLLLKAVLHASGRRPSPQLP